MIGGVKRRLSGWNAAIVIYAVVSLIALAGVLLKPGTVGHHWDWLIPSDPAELRRFASTSGFAWQDFAFGSYVTFRYATTLTSFLFGSPGFIGLDGAFVTKALLVSSLFASGVGMRFLLLTLTRDDPDDRDGAYATFGGLLYALAPYAYNQIVAGDQSALIADALSPIAIALAAQASFARDRIWLAYALGSSLLLAIVVASAQVFAFTIGAIWLVCLVLRPSGRVVLRLACVTACAVALCAFWILPVALAGGAIHGLVQTASVDRAFATFAQFSNPLLTLTTIAFPGDFYLHALGRGAALFFAAYALLIALCIAALFIRRSALLAVLCAVFALTAFLPLGGNRIVGPAILAIFKALLPYSLFLRTPQHLMFVVSLVVPMMVYLSARVIPRRFFTGSLAVGAIVFLGYGQGFFAHSDFFGLVGPFTETFGERATVDYGSLPGNDLYRTLYVPNAVSYYFHPAIFDYYFEGADEPQVRFVPTIAMGAGAKWTPYDGAQALLKALDELVPDGADAQTQAMLLKMSGVKQIVVHAIGTPGAGVRLAGDNARPHLERALAQTKLATYGHSFDDRSLWSVSHPVQRIYSADCVFGVSPQADPYDVLALAPAVATCERPAALPAAPRDRSEEVIAAATFRSTPDPGSALVRPRSNVPTVADPSGYGFSSTVPAGVEGVETYRLPPIPHNATGVSFRLYSSAPGRVWLQLYDPGPRGFYQTNIDFADGQVQDVALNFPSFGRLGRVDSRRIRDLRLVLMNPQLRDVRLFFGAFRWIVTPKHSRVPSYLFVAGNLWDPFYFGGDRDHAVFRADPGRTPVYATARLDHAGVYDVIAHVQENTHALALQLSIDGKTLPCTSDPTRVVATERLVRLARLPLRTGSHTLRLRYCSTPPPSLGQTVGVQSLILADAGFGPPARRTSGTVDVIAQGPGTIRLRTSGRVLIFSDSYDARWTASQAGHPLQHAIANGYANEWLVPDPAAGDVTLSFGPQRAFDVGLRVTLALGCFALIAIVAIVATAQREAVVQPRAVVEPSGGIS